jgi:hypothetical protein
VCTAPSLIRQGIVNLYNSFQCCGPQAIGNANDPGNPGIQIQPAGNDNPGPVQPAQPVQPVQPEQPQVFCQLLYVDFACVRRYLTWTYH